MIISEEYICVFIIMIYFKYIFIDGCELFVWSYYYLFIDGCELFVCCY